MTLLTLLLCIPICMSMRLLSERGYVSVGGVRMRPMGMGRRHRGHHAGLRYHGLGEP